MRRLRLDESLVGTVVEQDFTIVEFLGAGAMGATYRARQLSLSRDVCIKFLSLSSLSDAESVRRFKREARVLARLKHKNIVECYAFGIFENIYPYLVMELVSGQSLRRVLQDGALDWKRSCKIVLQASDALQSAHLQGIVHRDVKPDNIMLCGEDLESVKVIDFGLAGKIGAVEGFETLTSPGKIFGTPNYMPPEAFSGAAGAAGDVYALGCVLHECVSGARPFDGDGPVAVMKNQLTEVLPPFNRSIEPAEVRIALDEIVRRATAKNSFERFASCAHLSETLADAGIAPHLVPASVRPALARQDRKPIAIISAVFLLIVAMSIPLVIGTLSRRTHGTGKLGQSNVFSEVASRIGSPALPPPPVDASVVRKEMVSLTATARALTDRWGAFKLDGTQTETRLFFRSLIDFVRLNGRSLEQIPSLQPQVSALCLALTDLEQTLPAASTVLRSELVNSQSDLLMAYGCFSGAARVLETKAALPKTFVIAQNSPGELAQMHHALGMRMEKTGKFLFARRLRPALHRYAQLPDGTELFLEFLRWNRTACAQPTGAWQYGYSLFAVAKGFTVKDRTVALKALADMIYIEASGGRIEQARTAMEVLLKNYPQPSTYEVIEFAELMVALKWDKRGEKFLADARDHARMRHDDFGFCLLESARLRLFGKSHSDVAQQCLSFLQSPSWTNEKLNWNTVSTVLGDLIGLAGDCKRLGKTADAMILLQQCQTILLAQKSRLFANAAGEPSVEGYGYYLYHLAELSLTVEPEEKRRRFCEEFLEFMEKHEIRFPDGFFPFAARAHMAHFLFVSGKQHQADVLFRWCDKNLERTFRTCQTAGWQNWFGSRAEWFRDAGYHRIADVIDKEVARRPSVQ